MAIKLFTIPLFSILFIFFSCSSPSKSTPDRSHGNKIETVGATPTTSPIKEPRNRKRTKQEEPKSEPEENLITEEGFCKETKNKPNLKIQRETETKDIGKSKPSGKSDGGMSSKVTSVNSFKGVDPNELRNFMKKNRKHVNNCYKENKTEDANSGDPLKVKLKINSEGKASSCEITQHLNNESVGNCTCNKIKTWNFPVKSKEYDLTYFWKFK
ncbi:MAG: AgmX/PglI C-terminal domain-containing protein [Myxococcota bacterium]